MAYVTSWTTNFYQQATSVSRKIWLDESKEYFYQAYLGDSGGDYRFKLGLFGRKTKHTASSFKKAKDEVQVVQVHSTPLPNEQVPFSYNRTSNRKVEEILSNEHLF